jgi:hypothetical protein
MADFNRAEIAQAVRTGAYKRLPIETLERYLAVCSGDASVWDLQAALTAELTRRDSRPERTSTVVGACIGAIGAVIALVLIVRALLGHH